MFLDEQPYRAIVVLVGGLRVCAIVDADSTSDAHVIRLIQDHIPSLPPQAARTHSRFVSSSRALDKENDHAPRVQRSPSKRLGHKEIMSTTLCRPNICAHFL